MSTYIDVEVLGTDAQDNYVLSISKEEFLNLVTFDPNLTIMHWDGNKPVVLEGYGEADIRTRGDESSDNNLVNLPKLTIVSD